MKVKSSKHFTENELKCKCGCGRAEMDADFMVKLEQIREYWGKPIDDIETGNRPWAWTY